LFSEIQLKSPNWLFGQRKYEENGSAPKVTSQEIANGGSQDDRRVDSFCDLNWLSSASDIKEEDIFQRYISRKCIFSFFIENAFSCSMSASFFYFLLCFVFKFLIFSNCFRSMQLLVATSETL
jgi:hypothetical protein